MRSESIPSEATRPHRRALFTFIIFFIVWLFFDGCLYVFLNKFQQNHNLFYGIRLPSDEQLDGFYQKHFHPQWGWDILKEKRGMLGNRLSHEYPVKAEYRMKIFGDSFTYGDGVGDTDTFQYILEGATGWEFLNYGVGGYGTDQALLKYKDNNIKTKYTALAILDENIGRCLTVWWGFYQNQSFGGTKPRFVIRDGSAYLVDNPIRTRGDLPKLKDIEFIKSLKKHDYWQGYYEKLNAPPALEWPATLTVVSHLSFFSKSFFTLVENYLFPSLEAATSQRKFYHLYDDNSEGFKTIQYIVDEFLTIARGRNEIPIIFIFPMRSSVDILQKFKRKPYQSLIEHLEHKKAKFIDFGDVFVKEEYEKFYQDGYGHFSLAGNKRIAAEIMQYVQWLEQ